MRIEDVDRTREVQGAADAILATLEAFELHWDGPVLRQSARDDRYLQALARLEVAGLAYPCSCSRSELAPSGADGAESRYPGRCRAGPARPDGPFAQRFRVDGFGPVTVHDRLQPPLSQSVDATVGDVVVRRRDGFWAYQLAVVVDDADQMITDVVRGLDLYDNTPRQQLLQRALGLPIPRYLHLPLVVDRDGAKLAKSRGAPPAGAREVSETLAQLLRGLGLAPPVALQGAPPHELLGWAVLHWDPLRIQGVMSITSGT